MIIIDMPSRKSNFGYKQGEFHNLIKELKLRDGTLDNKKASDAYGVVCSRVK